MSARAEVSAGVQENFSMRTQLALALERLPLHPGGLQAVMGSAQHGTSFLVWLRGLARLLESSSARLIYIAERRAADSLFQDHPCFQQALECLEIQLKLAAPPRVGRDHASLDRFQLVYVPQDAGLAGLDQLLVELGIAGGAADDAAGRRRGGGGISGGFPDFLPAGKPVSQPPGANRRSAEPARLGQDDINPAADQQQQHINELQEQFLHQPLFVLDWSMLGQHAQLELGSSRKLAWTVAIFQSAVAAHRGQGILCFPPGHLDSAKILRHLSQRLWLVRPLVPPEPQHVWRQQQPSPSNQAEDGSRPQSSLGGAKVNPTLPSTTISRLDAVVGGAQEHAGFLCPCSLWASPQGRQEARELASLVCPVCAPPGLALTPAFAPPAIDAQVLAPWAFRWTPAGGLGLAPVAEGNSPLAAAAPGPGGGQTSASAID